MHLHELMGWPGPMTHIQFVMWQDWLRHEMDVPSRSDHYLMQIASEVHKTKFKPEDTNKFKMKFSHEPAPDPKNLPFPPLTKEQIVNIRAAMHKATLQGKLMRVKPNGGR